MRAILLRHRGGLEAQLAELRRLDPRARIVDLDDLAHVTDADDWIVVRAAQARGLRMPAASYEDLRIETNERGPSCATYRGEALALTQLELALLASLVVAAGRPVSRESLVRECWKERTLSDFTRIEAAVCRLRKKLCAATHLNVQMDRGVGYRLARRVIRRTVPPPRGRRVLVAEADMRIRSALVKNLREFTVDTATTCARASRLLRDRHYVAAFVATELRDGDAYGLVPADCPTMMLAEDDDDSQRALDAGATAAWQKLDDPSDLRSFARRAASASEAYDEVLSSAPKR